MSDPLATIIAARLVIAAVDGGASLMAIMEEGRKMRPDLVWPTAFLSDPPIPGAMEPSEDAPTEPPDPS